jgi:uncharacterized protein (DUF2461 family)
MFRFTIRHLLWLMVVVAMAEVASSQEPANLPLLSVKVFNRSQVIGHLGHPLGTLVRVTGICVDGDTTQYKADAGKTLLQVEAVNGRDLDRPISFQFSRATHGMAKLMPGQRFDYTAHEWGTFDGHVELPGEKSSAHGGFYYQPEITIHKNYAVVK